MPKKEKKEKKREEPRRLALPRVMMNDREMIDRLWQSAQTMLEARRYHGPDGTIPLIDEKSDRQSVGEGMWTVRAADGHTYSITITLEDVTSIAQGTVIHSTVESKHGDHKILVAGGFNAKAVEYARTNGLEILTHQILRLDIPNHRDQPLFYCLSPSEAVEVRAQWGFDDYNMKKFFSDDPIVLYYGLQPGDVVRIVRPSPTAGAAIDYRYVTPEILPDDKKS